MIVLFLILNIIILILTAIKYASIQVPKEEFEENTQRNLCTIICIALSFVFCIIFIILYYNFFNRFFISFILMLTVLSSYISWEFFVRNERPSIRPVEAKRSYDGPAVKRCNKFIVLIVLLFSVSYLLFSDISIKPRQIIHWFTS